MLRRVRSGRRCGRIPPVSAQAEKHRPDRVSSHEQGAVFYAHSRRSSGSKTRSWLRRSGVPGAARRRADGCGRRDRLHEGTAHRARDQAIQPPRRHGRCERPACRPRRRFDKRRYRQRPGSAFRGRPGLSCSQRPTRLRWLPGRPCWGPAFRTGTLAPGGPEAARGKFAGTYTESRRGCRHPARPASPGSDHIAARGNRPIVVVARNRGLARDP